MTLAPGSAIGPYEIVALLGSGGMGAVYRARDTRLQREVAIKVLAPGVLADEEARERFRREALALARFSHPNIATVYDVGAADGADYIVMECVPGQTLAERLTTGRMSLRDALSMAVEVASALEEAHEHGVVHRDLKPANVIITPKGRAKVLDFGVAKLREAAESNDQSRTLTAVGCSVGTPLYMSPEQILGDAVDARTDLWSLGALLYESLAGAPPFQAPTNRALVRAITLETPRPLREARPEVPEPVERIARRALERDVDQRYQSASELVTDASAALATITGATLPQESRGVRFSKAQTAVALGIILALGIPATLLYRRSEQRRWAHEAAMPEFTRLLAGQNAVAGFQLLARAQEYLPSDTAIARMRREHTSVISIKSSPSGATVEIQDYPHPDSSWYRLGVTPLEKVTVPRGYFRWRISRAGMEPFVSAPPTDDEMVFALDSAQKAPPGMVWVPRSGFTNLIAFIGWVGPYKLPPFYIDKFEVTNRQFQQFVDSGGYRRREFWHENFVKDGHELTWEQAMPLFRDRSDRPGPSTWDGGRYPAGQDDYPVSGVSWYEASAYAAFAGKQLPTLAQWFRVAEPDLAGYTVQVSNISRAALAPVGSFKGAVGPYGTFDLAGNVREWIANAMPPDRHLLLGGAWNSQPYIYSEAEALSPFDRSPSNGFRCLRDLEEPAPELGAAIHPIERDFSKATPAPDPVFRAYRAMYAYNRSPLNATVEGVVADTHDWREEKVTFDPAYGSTRMPAYLFLPKNVRPPYQTVLFFPSARVDDIADSKDLGDIDFFDYVVKSGRAVMYPVYQDTYERRLRGALPAADQPMDIIVQRYKDAARSLDYLATRSDIDTTRFAYLGVSMGAAEGVIYTSLLQDRLKALVFLDGGFFLGRPIAGQDQADFAPRITRPVLMVNGRYDFSFSLERSQEPLFRMLGTSQADKRHAVLEAPHDVRAQRSQMVTEVLAWLDKYLGRID
ncbi:MAG TPA: protein kinase [Gemmatimonadaceae bacterium]|nr:protein kinase [Gemmatimonadaceae bacterium]